MMTKMFNSILVLVLLISLLCMPVQARTVGETVTYSATAITDERILSNRLERQINEYKGGELPFVGEAVFSEDENAFVKRTQKVPTTTQHLKTIIHEDGTTEEYYVTATRASKSASGHEEAGNLNVWAMVYWTEARDQTILVMEYTFSKSVHYFMQDGDCGVTRLDAENYVGYNDADINDASSTQYSPVSGQRYSLYNSYTAAISGGNGLHYEAFTYVRSSTYGTVEAYVRYRPQAA